MQPYPNPNYYAQYMQPQPQINPYMDRLNGLQQFHQNIQSQPVPMQSLVKIVENIDIVKTSDIPMDGNVYYFSKADGTEIYTKQWLANGQTRILTFKPFSDAECNNSADELSKSNFALSDEFKDAFMKRFDDLEMQMKEILSKSAPKNTASRAKKGAEDDE